MPKLSSKEDNRPATLWYWDDWFSSFDLRMCSLAARGLWVDMLGVMRQSEVKGMLITNGQQLNNKNMAKIAGCQEDEIAACLSELEERGVFSRTGDGTIINRRMYRESELAQKRAEAGKKGMEARYHKDNKEDNKGGSTPLTSVGNGNSLSLISKNPNESENHSKDDIRLVQILIDLMLGNNPESSIVQRLTPKRQSEWINQCRLMREVDNRTPEQIETIIRFSQSDSFWKGNILSMPKLRDKWDQLWMKAKRGDKFSGIREFLNEDNDDKR